MKINKVEAGWDAETANGIRRLSSAMALVSREMGPRTPLRKIAALLAIHRSPWLSVWGVMNIVDGPEKTLRADLLGLGSIDRFGKPGLRFIIERWDTGGRNAVLTYAVTPRGLDFLTRLEAAISADDATDDKSNNRIAA